MIPLNFGLLWSANTKMSYLRYLTLKTLRYFHPHSRIMLYIASSYKKIKSGNIGDQEYRNSEGITKDYIGELEKIGVEIIPLRLFGDMEPNFISDMFRYWYLKQYSGYYLDTDQIILRSFHTLPLKRHHKFVYSDYDVVSKFAWDNHFCPVGVLGAMKDSKILRYVSEHIMDYYNADDYSSIGPLMMYNVLQKVDKTEAFNAPSCYFYPAPICDYMKKVFSGDLMLTKDNYALHWYGGYCESQKFNKAFTEKFARKSNDTISRFLREKKII